ncbi:MAG: NAD+ synthase [Synoicihabitans sp.]
MEQAVDMVIFPELVICGYPPRDLLLKRRFGGDVETTLLEVAARCDEIPAIVGTLERNPAKTGHPFFNAAAWCQNGEIKGFARKCLLPTYDVFDEARYFEAAEEPTVFRINGRRIGVTICEDIWAQAEVGVRPTYRSDPIDQLGDGDLDLVINLSASPWHVGKTIAREQLVQGMATRLNAPVVYVNAVGGNDELVFDGRSLVVNANGQVNRRLNAFDSETVAVELKEAPSPVSVAPANDSMQDVQDALILGLRDYARKSGFNQALVALSGGIDSAVVAVLAREAFGGDGLWGVSLPSRISSQHSKDDAAALARNLGIAFDTIEIGAAVSACESALQPLFGDRPRDVAEENIQARIRGVFMMALSNKLGSLLLTTGNKSEIAVGYCTLYGDMCGGLAVISDVLKTQVFDLARWINRDREIIPWNTINKPPSAELSPGQEDQDSLPPYDILDGILQGYIERGLSKQDLVDQGYAEEVVSDIIRKVDLNEYKRKQAAPGLKITPLAFGVGRRIPIVQKYVS